jgi:predicted membrane metal-binding protein
MWRSEQRRFWKLHIALGIVSLIGLWVLFLLLCTSSVPEVRAASMAATMVVSFFVLVGNAIIIRLMVRKQKCPTDD